MKNRNLISSLFGLLVGVVFGQVVTGFVTDDEGKPLGANVVVVGTEKGGVTDKMVNTLSTSEKLLICSVSFIGYSPKLNLLRWVI